MIKRFKLRGISHTPSDRTTADGGCSESLNVQMVGDEIAPALEPRDLTESLTGDEEMHDPLEDSIFFIHKTSDGDHYFGRGDEDELVVWTGEETRTTIKENFFAEGSEISGACNIGNTIIITETLESGAHNTYFVLYKDGQYKYVGTSMPEPIVEFAPEYTTGTRGSTVLLNNAYIVDEQWNDILQRKNYTDTRYDDILKTQSKIWETVTSWINGSYSNGYFSLPFLVRYGLRLFDGSYAFVSAPVYMGAGVKEVIQAEVRHHRESQTSQTSGYYTTVDILLPLKFKVKAYLRNASTTGWEDYIESIDLFMSPYIPFPEMEARIKSVGEAESITPPVGSTDIEINSFSVAFEGEEADIKNNIKQISTFSKIASFSPSEFSSLTAGYDLLSDASIGKQEVRLTRDTLISDYTPIYSAGLTHIYNERMMAANLTETLPFGYRSYFAPGDGDGASESFSPTSFKIVYYVNGNDGKVHKVKGRGLDNGYSIAKGSGISQYYRPYWVLFYPNANCFRADVYWNARVISIPMEAMTNVNAAMGYLGVDLSFEDVGWNLETVANQFSNITENREIKSKNKLVLSNTGNPFSFDIASTCYFQDSIIDMAAVTKALSTGQVGQFDVMVFTEGGIHAVKVGADGSFTATNPLTREVALPGTVSPIDQAIIFSTEKGIMMLSGSDVIDLSPNMKGAAWLPSPMPTLATDDADWTNLFPLITDTTFIDFVKGARTAYDYKNARLFIYHPIYRYMYVYMLQSATWHKVARAGFTGTCRALNSYPDCLFCESDSNIGEYRLFDYSVVPTSSELSSDTIAPRAGVIITRTMDFEEPDVRKVLRDIRIRGKYNKGDVRYIPYGSMDGLNWKRLTSLRGGSFKLFRLLILTHLSPTERISWVDIDYETRFTDKLR